MKMKIYTFILGTLVMISSNLLGQANNNCFLYDYEPKIAEIPSSIDAVKPTKKVSVIIRLKSDTIGKVSKYVFGNALAAWCGAYNDQTLIKNTKLLAPTLLRFPGGSWADGWFLNKVPSDVPDSVYDGTTYNNSSIKGTKKNAFGGNSGLDGSWTTSTKQYYALRDNSNVYEGLITINYAYARYGTSKNPVAQAAHMAADWVRYDSGRTKFWEIGNENGGPWEYGWMIDTSKNKDGQPIFISGDLYGKHFLVFADSMKKAAAEIGTTIYIGAQVMASDGGTGQWGTINSIWNQGLFGEIGDKADFYVVHNYFDNSTNIRSVLTSPGASLKSNANYVNADIKKFKAASRPIALTEYNMSPGASANEGRSYVNGMQAAVLICEMIKDNIGLGARWYLNTGLAGSDFNSNYANHPFAEFYYLTYLQKYFGDICIGSTSSNANLLCYASRYSSGETELVLVNSDTTTQTISVSTDSVGVGSKYYIFTFTSDKDSGNFSPDVYINGNGPSGFQFGPYDSLFNIKAYAYTIDNEIKFTIPGRSLQMITIEKGTNHTYVSDSVLLGVKTANTNLFKLYQNYPNPVKNTTLISYELPERLFVTLRVYNLQGREINTLVNENQNTGHQSVSFNTSGLQNGVYFYSIDAGKYHDVKKLIIIK
jgi:hypothetical protein